MAFYDPIINTVIDKVIKSPNFKARILAAVRHGITSAGAGLVTAGYANSSIIDAAAGLAVMAVSFYLSQLDVTLVDGKIKVALHSEPPQPETSRTAPIIPVEVIDLPPLEDPK
jgi:hypothetical protein